MLYLLIALICVYISGVLFKKGCGTISLYRPNMMSIIFYYYLVLQCVIGSILIVNHIDDHYIINKLQYESSRIIGFWAIMYTIITFPIGMMLANKIWGVKNILKLFNSYCKKPISKENIYGDKIVRSIWIIISLCCFFSVIYVFLCIRELSILKMFSGASASDILGFRLEVSRQFPGNEYIKNIIALGLTPLMSYIAYGYMKRDNSLFNRIWFWLLFLCSINILCYNLEKSPIIVYLFSFIFFRIYNGYSLNKKALIGCILVIILVVIILYTILMGTGDNYNDLLNGIIGRLTLTSIAGMFMEFDIWHGSYEHLGFTSLSSFFSEIFNIPFSERSPRIVMSVVNPELVRSGLYGMVNSLFIGEAFANWGLFGAIISPFWVGFVIQSLYIFFLRSRKTPFFLAFFVSYSFKAGITGGINGYIYNVGIITYILIIISIYSLCKFFNYSYFERKSVI